MSGFIGNCTSTYITMGASKPCNGGGLVSNNFWIVSKGKTLQVLEVFRLFQWKFSADLQTSNTSVDVGFKMVWSSLSNCDSSNFSSLSLLNLDAVAAFFSINSCWALVRELRIRPKALFGRLVSALDIAARIRAADSLSVCCH